MKINVFLPCRKGSQRVPKKNIKPFDKYKYGLIEIKLNQLLQCNSIDNIYLSTNDEEIIDFAKSLNNNKIIIHHRIDELSSSETSTDELISHALDLIKDGEILWTHVTSPFLNANEYEKIILKYKEMKNKEYDSLMSTTLIHGFLWDDHKPINYDRKREKWPRTQTIRPVHEVNSGVFLAHSDIYRNLNDRIGNKPYLYVLDKIIGFDIDWEEDFIIAKAILESKVAKI